MRAFIGIDFPSELKKEIFTVQQTIKGYAQKGRWKDIDNFHLTLKFLGEINLAQQASIDAAMEILCAKVKPFSLAVKGLGTFNNKEKIKVLWLGIDGDLVELNSVHREIDISLAPIGFLEETRKYNPHITIGQDLLFAGNFDQIKETIGEIELGETNFSNLYLFKSEHVQNRLTYTKVREYHLGRV